MSVSPNTIVETMYCKDCDAMSIGMWYTKRGRENRMCMKCGKTWEIQHDSEIQRGE